MKSKSLPYVVSSVLLLLVCGASAGILVKLNFFPADSVAKSDAHLATGHLTGTHPDSLSDEKPLVKLVDLDLNKRSLSNFTYSEDSFGVKFTVKSGFGIRKVYDSTRPFELFYASNKPTEFATQVCVSASDTVRTLLILANNKVLVRHELFYDFTEKLNNLNNLNLSNLTFFNQNGKKLNPQNFTPNLHNLSYGYLFNTSNTGNTSDTTNSVNSVNTVNSMDNVDKMGKIKLFDEVVYDYEKMKEFGVITGVYFNPLTKAFFLTNTENDTMELGTGMTITTTISIVNVVDKRRMVGKNLKLDKELDKLVEKGYVAESGTVFTSVLDGEQMIWSSDEDYAVKVLVKEEMVGIIMLNGTFKLFQKVNNNWQNITQQLLYTHLTQ